MVELRRLISFGVVGALLSTSAVPAMARPWGYGHGGYGYGHGYRPYHRHRHGVSGGDVLAGILILGTIAAVASAASKSGETSARYPDRDPRYSVRADDNDGADDRTRNDDAEDRRGDIASENEAIDACAVAAEQRADTGQGTASVRDITRVDAVDDGFEIEGIVETRSSYRDRSGDNRRFTCSVRFGAVDSVYIEDDIALR